MDPALSLVFSSTDLAPRHSAAYPCFLRTTGYNSSMRPEQIKSLRERLQMTQEEFAKHVGLQTRGAVSKLESGAKTPTGPLARLLQVLADQQRSGSK